jgi:hypothetical protein
MRAPHSGPCNHTVALTAGSHGLSRLLYRVQVARTQPGGTTVNQRDHWQLGASGYRLANAGRYGNCQWQGVTRRRGNGVCHNVPAGVQQVDSESASLSRWHCGTQPEAVSGSSE